MIYTVLRQSPDYRPAHVEWLRSQIVDDEVVTISDVPVKNRIVMKYGWPAWWSKMELFRPDIPGDIFYLDIDTVVWGNVSKFQSVNRTTMLSDFYRPASLQSSMMFLTEADRAKVWQAWCAGPTGHIDRIDQQPHGMNGDQTFIEEVLGRDVQRWQELFPERVVSWKVHMSNKPEPISKPDIIIFHGRPRPWEAGFSQHD